jgi:uncharacterized protein
MRARRLLEVGAAAALVGVLLLAAGGFYRRWQSNEALVKAVCASDARAAAAVLRQGADPNTRDGYGVPMVWYAAARPSGGLLKALLKAGGRPESAGRAGSLPLVWAASAGYRDIVQILLAHGADVNRTDGEGRSALMGAAHVGDPRIVRDLLRAGARVDRVGPKGETAIANARAQQRTNGGLYPNVYASARPVLRARRRRFAGIVRALATAAARGQTKAD